MRKPHKYTKETIEKMRQSHQGKYHSEETKRKIGEALNGRKLSEEHKKNIGESIGGKIRVLREIRVCALPGCNITFECKVNDPKKFCSISCSSKRNVGKNNPMFGTYRSGNLGPNWLGGISNFPYSFNFNEEFKILIRERDNNTCQLCGRTKEEEGRNLCVHHIYYDKMNECTNENDFITLCRKCNGKVNGNRKYYVRFFQQKLKLCIVNQIIPYVNIDRVLGL